MFGLLLLFPSLADRATRPLVALGARLSQNAAGSARSTFLSSLLLGVATGLLWAPCAGPVLGLLLTGAALNGASAQISLLLLAYALGAATSLALALLVGGRVFAAMKRSIRAGEWLRRGLGGARYALTRWWEYCLAQGWAGPVEYFAPPFGRGSLLQGWSAMPAAVVLKYGVAAVNETAARREVA